MNVPAESGSKYLFERKNSGLFSLSLVWVLGLNRCRLEAHCDADDLNEGITEFGLLALAPLKKCKAGRFAYLAWYVDLDCHAATAAVAKARMSSWSAVLQFPDLLRLLISDHVSTPNASVAMSW